MSRFSLEERGGKKRRNLWEERERTRARTGGLLLVTSGRDTGKRKHTKPPSSKKPFLARLEGG